jgi:hypothetical protein
VTVYVYIYHHPHHFQLSHLPSNAVVLTLRTGNEVGNERIECRLPLHAGQHVHLQQHVMRIPGLAEARNDGFRAVTVLASNEVTCEGLCGVEMRAKGILPWGDRAVERNVQVPEAIDEVCLAFVWNTSYFNLLLNIFY